MREYANWVSKPRPKWTCNELWMNQLFQSMQQPQITKSVHWYVGRKNNSKIKRIKRQLRKKNGERTLKEKWWRKWSLLRRRRKNKKKQCLDQLEKSLEVTAKKREKIADKKVSKILWKLRIEILLYFALPSTPHQPQCSMSLVHLCEKSLMWQ